MWYFSPLRLAGPVFDKELRVASRRPRSYLLRCAYVCLLGAVMLYFWHSIARVGGGASGMPQVARLGEVGKKVIVTVVWSQFIMAQVLAVVLLSDAISGEIRRRTLEDLLVTPIRAIHVVLGKLLSRLLQVVLLLAISLPVLTVVRVLGGVPWDYVVSGLCVTLSATVFAGSLSLLCSILYRDAYHAVLAVAFWYVVLWGLDAFVLIVLPRTSYLGNPAGAFLWSLASPFHALHIRTQTMLTGPSPASPYVPVTLHCLTILLAATILLVLSARRVRRIPCASTHAQVDAWEAARGIQPNRTIRHVKGSPIVWKDRETPLFQTRNQALLHVGLWLAVGGLVLVALLLAKPAVYGSFFIPILIVQWVFIIRLGVAAAGCITREKEARTWPILLATPLDDGEIIQGKARGALRRNLSLLIPLLALYLLAFLFGRPGERDLPHLALCVGLPVVNLLGTVLFLLGVGLYAGTKCRTTAGAAVLVFGTYFGLVLVSSLLPTGVLGIPAQDHSAGVPDAVPLWILLALVYSSLGLLSLLYAAHTLRRSAFLTRGFDDIHMDG